jgi:hypothetical protein
MSEITDRILTEEVSSKLLGGLRAEVRNSILRGEDSVYRRAVVWYVNTLRLG